MRRTALMLIVACFVLSGLTLVAAQNTQPTAPCRDQQFTDGVTSDFDSMAQNANNLTNYIKANQDNIDGVLNKAASTISTLIDMRHKYEDLTVSDECEPLRVIVVAFIGNLADEVTYSFVELQNPSTSQHYADLESTQETRVGVINQQLQDFIATQDILLTATITPTKSNVRITFTPGGNVATKAPVATKLQQIAPTIAATAVGQPTVAQATAAGNGATALCNDGTLSYAKTHSGACSGHKGVKTFYK